MAAGNWCEMMDTQPNQATVLLRIIRPWLLAASLLTYFLGLGIARYLYIQIDWTIAGLSYTIIVLLLEMRAFLEAFYLHPKAPENMINKRVKTEDPYPDSLEVFQRPALLMISVILLGAGALFTTLLLIRNNLNVTSLLLLGFGFLLSFFSSVPPLEFNRKGYGDLIEALLIATFSPAFALSMQHGELNILWVMLTLPLTLIYLAMRITFLLQAYGNDILTNTQSMLVRMGWQRGMALHNYLIIGGYLLIGAFAIIHLPWALTWPAILSLPLGGLQILQIQQISAGARPNWKLLILNAVGTFTITAYSIALTLWIG